MVDSLINLMVDSGIDGDVGDSKIMDWMKVIKWLLIAMVAIAVTQMVTVLIIVLAGYKLMINW